MQESSDCDARIQTLRQVPLALLFLLHAYHLLALLRGGADSVGSAAVKGPMVLTWS